MGVMAVPIPLRWTLLLGPIAVEAHLFLPSPAPSSGDFRLSLVVNNTHKFVIFPSASGLGKMCSQDGRARDSKRVGRHLMCSTMDTIIMMSSMYQ